jgi:hypothetical protein
MLSALALAGGLVACGSAGTEAELGNMDLTIQVAEDLPGRNLVELEYILVSEDALDEASSISDAAGRIEGVLTLRGAGPSNGFFEGTPTQTWKANASVPPGRWAFFVSGRDELGEPRCGGSDWFDVQGDTPALVYHSLSCDTNSSEFVRGLRLTVQAPAAMAIDRIEYALSCWDSHREVGTLTRGSLRNREEALADAFGSGPVQQQLWTVTRRGLTIGACNAEVRAFDADRNPLCATAHRFPLGRPEELHVRLPCEP